MNQDEKALGGQRRGCNCKKSNCLKLYCDCFASGGRCNERCQCESCKNQVHNRNEIAQAIQIIEQRKQKSLRSIKQLLEHETMTESRNHSSTTRIETTVALPVQPQATKKTASSSSNPTCTCKSSSCSRNCPCLSFFGSCSVQCPCKGCHAPSQFQQTKGCSCKKSNCLKLYCECLAAQKMCTHRCHCEGCKNRPETVAAREQAVAAIVERNPLAFQPKVASGSHQHHRGCNCRKSGCVKNYCECHQAGVACTSRCACHLCRNTETLVSAKKILEFAGVHTDTRNPRVTARPSERKLAKQPYRASVTNAKALNGMLTPTNVSTRRPSALELLSRSAPEAPSMRHQREDSIVGEDYVLTPSKRSSSHMDRVDTAIKGTVTPTFSKRRYIRHSLTKLPFTEQIQEIVVPLSQLMSEDNTGPNAFNEPNTAGVGESMRTTIPCHSLLQTSTALHTAAEDKESAVSTTTGQVFVGSCSGKCTPQQTLDSGDDRPMLSPTAAGLFCEEIFDESTAADATLFAATSNDTRTSPRLANHQAHHVDGSLTKRAVLQEYSVWLRNMVAK